MIQDNYKNKEKDLKDKKKRSFANTKKSISNYDNNIVEIDKPKSKIHRQHTQDRTVKMLLLVMTDILLKTVILTTRIRAGIDQIKSRI